MWKSKMNQNVDIAEVCQHIKRNSSVFVNNSSSIHVQKIDKRIRGEVSFVLSLTNARKLLTAKTAILKMTFVSDVNIKDII